MNTFEDDVVKLVDNALQMFMRRKSARSVLNCIRRGQAPSSAPEFKEELAKLVEKHTSEDINLIIDFPLNFQVPSANKFKNIRPDIGIVRNNCLVEILEAKIDLGFAPTHWKHNREQILKDLISSDKVANKGEKEFAVSSVSSHLKSAFVILTARNCRELLEKESADDVVILLSKKHLYPNDGGVDGKSYISEIRTQENREQWRKLEPFVLSFIDN